MRKEIQIGKQSFVPEREVYIRASASVVGKKEGEGPLGGSFDMVGEEHFGCDTWEEAESCLQKEAVTLVLGKAGMKKEEMRFLFAGDLLGQCTASSFAASSFGLPFLGVYGACSTCGEALGLGTMAVGSGVADHVVCVTSSHFASAEKEFRFPLAYGNQRPPAAEWTVTGAGAFILSEEKKDGNIVKITGATFGKIVDYGIKDSLNMGCCMAPAAADTIKMHLQDFHREVKDYDRIFTGDLGTVGSEVLCELLKKDNITVEEKHMDCGMEMYDRATQNVQSGGSGCGCSATVLAGWILNKMKEGTWKRILFVPTGALLSKVSYNEGRTVPGVAHAIVLESL